MVDVPTREEFEARLATAETAIVDLRRRVGILESATPGGPGGSTLPALSSVRASAVTTSGATLSGVVEPRGLAFTWQFEYGPSTSYGSVSPGAATPSVAPVANIGPTTSTLRQGSVDGPQMYLAGMNVWGISDSITGSFGTGQYNNRVAIATTLKAWGVNYVRLRLLANDYNGMSAANQAAYIAKVVDWRDTLRAVGILMCPTWWDALDGTYAGASWAANHYRSFAMMNAVIAALGNDPYVFYEPFNEPNNITDAAWDTAMRATIANFRTTAGYKGLLVIDGNNWSHAYDNTRFSGLESYDSTLTGTGRANLSFARHDYPNDYSGNTWNSATWTAATGGTDRNHILIESEYGVYNNPTNVVSWGSPSSTFFASQMHSQANFAGAAPFVFGPWLDPNAITGSDNSTVTTWGGYAKNNFLANAAGSAVPAYTPQAPGAGSGVGVGTGQQTVSTTLTSLAGNALYHARLKATSSAGTSYSPDFTFSTASTPSTPVITYDHSFEDSAVGTGNNQAQYTGSSWTTVSGGTPSTADFSYRYATAAGDKVTLRFYGSRLVIYGPDNPSGALAAQVTVDGAAAGTASFYTTSTPANGVRFDTGNLGSADADHVVVITVPSTANKTIYFDHAEVYILTSGGTTVTAPAVTTNPVVGITGSSAVLSGFVTPNNGTTSWRFDFGTTTSYGGTWPIPDGSVPATAGPTAVSVTVNSGLAVNTTYHYRLRATNSAGTTSTADGTFTTTATTSATGRITRSGKTLQLNGGRFKFAGMNWSAAVGCGLAGSQPDAASAAQYFAELNPRSMTRIWVVPGMDLAKYDAVFNAAKAAGQYLCVVLFNSAAFCTNYVPGYATPLDSTAASWIQQVATRHANEPTVAMYECANDAPETNGNIANWYQAVGALVKQYDPQALVGTGGGIALNNAAAIAAVAAGASVDLISYHDNYAPAGAVGPRAAAYDAASNTANKPWYMGSRSFYLGGDTGSLATNGQRLTTEYSLYIAGSLTNCAGYLYQGFDLVQTDTVTADFGNGLWDAAKTYNNAAYNGSTPGTGGGGGGGGTPGTGWWVFGGSYNHNIQSASDDWERVMAGGRPVTANLAYQTRGSGWGAMLNTAGYPFDRFTNKSRQMILQLSPFPTNVGATYAALVSGAYDSYWANFGAGLKAREDSGHRPVICCVAWEMNGTYFPWGGGGGGSHFSSSAQYIAGYQRIVNALRSTYSGAETAFVINGHASNPQANSWELYPGDSYVTYIGGDWYNWYDGNPQTQAAFDAEANDPDGIRWMLAKVRAAGPDARGRAKKLIVPEWGIAAGYGTPGDNANWVRWMVQVFKDAHATGHMGPENYFNEASGSVFDIYFTHPNARAAYKALYAP